MYISALLTCHNRRPKTMTCLKSLIKAIETYNNNHNDIINIEIFLVDDGCTDGTAEAAREVIPDVNVLHIFQGDGNLYWAGGMRFCWRKALKHHDKWDYYLLLNDDVELMENVFDELFEAQRYAVRHYGKEGLVSGITCDQHDETKMTYGGKVWVNKFLGTVRHLPPTGEPQLCVLTNANILLVSKTVVDDIGIFYDGYTHGCADSDYSVMATRAGFPVVLTSHFCGRCESDHDTKKETAMKIKRMSFKERKAYFNYPIHSNKDYLLFVWRVMPLRYPMVWLGRAINLYLPKLYYQIGGFRDAK